MLRKGWLPHTIDNASYLQTASSETETKHCSAPDLIFSSTVFGGPMSVIEDTVHDGAGAVSKAFSIESARAGEAGKGFAVVASEVKNLAN